MRLQYLRSVTFQLYQGSALLACWALLSTWGYGCGYHFFELTLPDGDRRIAVAPIQNLTYTPGLSVLLRSQLLEALAQSGGLRVVQSPQEADWVLKITLSDASVLTESPTTASGNRNFTHTLSGRWILEKQGFARRRLGPNNISSTITHSQAGAVLDTPGLKLYGWRLAAASFSKNLVSRIVFCVNCVPPASSAQD